MGPPKNVNQSVEGGQFTPDKLLYLAVVKGVDTTNIVDGYDWCSWDQNKHFYRPFFSGKFTYYTHAAAYDAYIL